MDNVNKIVVMQGQEGKNPFTSNASGLSKEDIHAFAAALRESNASGKTNEIAAKLARILDGKKIDRAELAKLLQQSPQGSDILKKLSALLQDQPEVKPALTSDLTSSASVTLQQDSGSLIEKLKEQFAALGDMTDAKLSDFRQGAIKLMKEMGLDDGEIESNLVQLAMGLGSKLSDEQATLLMMPFRPDASAAPTVASAPLKPHAPAASPTTPQQLAEQQLQDAAAKTPAANKAHEAFDAKVAAPQAKPEQQAPVPQDTQAAAKPAPQQSTASTLALVNSYASDGGASGFDGQQSGQWGGQQTGYTPSSLISNAQTAGSTSAGSFINYMNGASAGNPATTQMIALQIQHNAQTQVDTFRMQLQPEELGKLEIRLKFDRDGMMKAHLVVDKADTLTMLQKDAPQLQRILQGAGLNLDDGSLSFNLRQQQQDNKPYNDQGNSKGADAGDDEIMPSGALQAKIAVGGMGTISQGGVNIMV